MTATLIKPKQIKLSTTINDPGSDANIPTEKAVRTALSGMGNVSGPVSSTDDDIVTFDGADGKTIQDSGTKISDLVRFTVLTNTNEPTGFIGENHSTLSFSDGSRELSIVPSGSSFSFYSAGTLYTKTTTQTKQITVASGIHYVYFDTSGELQESTSAWDIASANSPVACVYWNGTTGLLLDERHGCQMDGRTHEYLHETHGSAFASGMAGTFAANGSTMTIGAGEWYDDDLEWNISEQTQCRIFYLDGSIWKWTSPQSSYYHTVSSVPQYNNSGALANVDTAKYSISWVYIINSITTPVAVVMGQNEYNTQALAEAAGVPNLGSLPATEMILLYKVIWQRSGAVITWKRTDDYRRVSGGPVQNYIASDHGALAGLTDNDHPQYILDPTTSPEQGDLLYYNGTTWERLAHGTSSQYLKSGGNAANPGWDTPAGAVSTDSIWDTKGDLAVGTGSNTATILASGTEGQVLTVSSGSGTGLAWTTPSSGGVTCLGYSYSISDSVLNPDPAVLTAIDSMSVAFTLTETHIIKISFMFTKTGAHPEHVAVFDGVTQLFPSNANGQIYDFIGQENNHYALTYISYVSLASGSHTILVKAAAALSTAQVTYRERFLIIEQIG